MSTFELTSGQSQLLERLIIWFKSSRKDKPYFSYSGLAGTGKTFMVKEFIKELKLESYEYLAGAYTGKAALVLSQEGIPATTIHSMIYNITPYKEIINRDEMIIDSEITPRYAMKLTCVLKDLLPSCVRLIIIDEATMVNDKMRDEILSFGIPVIFMGDNHQLPPVFGISSVMNHPDFQLTEIMRQKKDDPIVKLSHMILDDEEIPYDKYGLSSVTDYHEIDKSLLKDFDMTLCGFNKTREDINNKIRHDVLNIPSKTPKIGERLICRRNNWALNINGIFLTNGLVGLLTDYELSNNGKFASISFKPEFMDEAFTKIKMDYKYIQLDTDERKLYGMSQYNLFEYAYALSVHLVQGSSFDRVLFYDMPFRDYEMTKKVEYTAITRARTMIEIVRDEYSRMRLEKMRWRATHHYY